MIADSGLDSIDYFQAYMEVNSALQELKRTGLPVELVAWAQGIIQALEPDYVLELDDAYDIGYIQALRDVLGDTWKGEK